VCHILKIVVFCFFEFVCTEWSLRQKKKKKKNSIDFSETKSFLSGHLETMMNTLKTFDKQTNKQTKNRINAKSIKKQNL
jgi:hypothetical protein